MFQRSYDASGMHRDDITKEIMAHFGSGVTITDGLGHRLYVEKALEGPKGVDISDSWLQITDHRGNVGWVFVGIGR